MKRNMTSVAFRTLAASLNLAIVEWKGGNDPEATRVFQECEADPVLLAVEPDDHDVIYGAYNENLSIPSTGCPTLHGSWFLGSCEVELSQALDMVS